MPDGMIHGVSGLESGKIVLGSVISTVATPNQTVSLNGIPKALFITALNPSPFAYTTMNLALWFISPSVGDTSNLNTHQHTSFTKNVGITITSTGFSVSYHYSQLPLTEDIKFSYFAIM